MQIERPMRCKRVVISRPGGPEVLQVVEEELPEPHAGEVRVKVQAAGVAVIDTMVRKGLLPFPLVPRIPFSPGMDVVGVVDKPGSEVSSLSTGQPAAALLPRFGGYSEFVVVPEKFVLPIPGGIDPAEGVCLVLNYLTASRLLLQAKVKQGERILVHGAAGGIGTALLELGKEQGLEMYGTDSADKQELVAKLGATPIDYRQVDFVEKIFELTGDGVDAVFDGIGGENLSCSYKALGKGGRLINYGMIGPVSRGGLPRLLGSFVRLFSLRLIPDGKKVWFYGDTPAIVKKNIGWYRTTLTGLFNMLAEQKIKPIVGARLPLVEAARAHELLESASVTGRIVLLA